MKQPLGRNLKNLMTSDLPEDASGGRFTGSAEDVLAKPAAGVDRLIRGSGQPETEVPRPAAPSRPFTSALVADSTPARVPDWIFYLGDLALMSAAVWMIVLKMLEKQPMTLPQVLMCLALGILAAAIGFWPWLRNVLYCETVGELARLPKWGMMTKEGAVDETKQLVVHLRKPHMIVEVHETAWNGIHAKPYWIDEPPNLPPGGVKALLDEAVEHFKKWKEASAAAPDFAVDPSNADAKQ